MDCPITPDLLATPHRFLWHASTGTAILSDLHLGAMGIPCGAHIQTAWNQLVQRAPRHVIFAGDLMDDPAVGDNVLDAFRALLPMLPPQCRVTLTPGNHDPLDLASRLGLAAADAIRLADYVISHGDRVPALLDDAPSATWIVGHQHPAVALRTRVQAAKMACYVRCTPSPRRRALLLLPAFSRDAGGPLGANLLAAGNWLLPVPRPSPENMRILGLIEPEAGAPQVLDFGTLAELEKLAGG